MEEIKLCKNSSKKKWETSYLKWSPSAKQDEFYKTSI